MKAIVLAAGFGTRLWPLTEDRTKPAVPFLGKPLVAYAVEYVRDAGIRDVAINLHHRPESIERALGDGSALGVRIHYSHETEILGSGGAIDRLRPWIDDDELVVVNGKIVTDLSLAAAVETHRRRDALATLVCKPNRQRERFSTVDVSDDGNVRGFGPYPDPETSEDPAPLMFTGIQILSPRILDYVPRGVFSHTTSDAYPAAIAAGETVVAHVADGEWREMSTLERYLGESIAVMESWGLDNVVGRGSSVDDGASVARSVLWDGVVVEAGAVVRESILGDGVRVLAGEIVERSVVVRADMAREIERGTVRNGLLVVPLGPVLD